MTSLHIHVNLKCTQYGWEEHIVMWLRMGMMNIIEWCMFSGGCLSSEEHAMMQSCIDIVGKGGGNAT